ncbi:hypothetical protein KEM56_002014, partial [Ascosphaera pollenicola]
MAFQPKEIILDNPVSPGFSFADLHSKLIHQSKPTSIPFPPPRSSFTDSSSSSSSSSTTDQTAATRKRTCHGSSDTCSFMNNVDDSESMWTSRTSSGFATPEPRASTERCHLQDAAVITAALKKKTIHAAADRSLDVEMPDLNCRPGPFENDDGFSRDTPMDQNPASVFLPVTTISAAADGKRKRCLSHSEYADEYGDDVTGQSADQRRGELKQQQQQQQQQEQHRLRFSLTSIMNNLLGGLPSKVWNFCCESSFRGFHAGGGKGYEMKAAEQPPDYHPETMATDSLAEDLFGETESIPSHKREADHPTLDEYRSTCSDFGPRHTFSSESSPNGMGSSWVVVKQNSSNSSTNSDHHRVPTATSIFSAPAAYVNGFPDNDDLAPPPRKHPRRNTIVHPVTPRPRRVNGPGSGRRRQPWSASRLYVQSRSVCSNPSPSRSGPSANGHWASDTWDASDSSSLNACSPAAIEAQRLAAQLRRQERERDADFRRMNQTIKSMMKEAREAL